MRTIITLAIILAGCMATDEDPEMFFHVTTEVPSDEPSLDLTSYAAGPGQVVAQLVRDAHLDGSGQRITQIDYDEGLRLQAWIQSEWVKENGEHRGPLWKVSVDGSDFGVGFNFVSG